MVEGIVGCEYLQDRVVSLARAPENRPILAARRDNIIARTRPDE